METEINENNAFVNMKGELVKNNNNKMFKTPVSNKELFFMVLKIILAVIISIIVLVPVVFWIGLNVFNACHGGC